MLYPINVIFISVTMATIATTLPASDAIYRSPFSPSMPDSSYTMAASSGSRLQTKLSPVGLIQACRKYVQQIASTLNEENSYRPDKRKDDLDRNGNSFGRQVTTDDHFDEDDNENGDNYYNINDLDPVELSLTEQGQVSPFDEELADSLSLGDDLSSQNNAEEENSDFQTSFFQENLNSWNQDFRGMYRKCLEYGLDRLLQSRDKNVVPKSINRHTDDELRTVLDISSDPKSLIPVISDPAISSPLLTSEPKNHHRIVRFRYKSLKPSTVQNHGYRKRSELRNLPVLTSSNRAYLALLNAVRSARAKRAHRLSINGPSVIIANMLVDEIRRGQLQAMQKHFLSEG